MVGALGVNVRSLYSYIFALGAALAGLAGFMAGPILAVQVGMGDSVLVRASRLLSSIVRPGDTEARLGGDEFAVLMVDVERPETVVDFAVEVMGGTGPVAG